MSNFRMSFAILHSIKFRSRSRQFSLQTIKLIVICDKDNMIIFVYFIKFIISRYH